MRLLRFPVVACTLSSVARRRGSKSFVVVFPLLPATITTGLPQNRAPEARKLAECDERVGNAEGRHRQITLGERLRDDDRDCALRDRSVDVVVTVEVFANKGNETGHVSFCCLVVDRRDLNWIPWCRSAIKVSKRCSYAIQRPETQAAVPETSSFTMSFSSNGSFDSPTI